MIAASDVDYIDPGAAYYQFTYMVTSATQSQLEGYAPDDVEQPTPLLATEAPDGLRGRQDDHLHDPRRRQVLAAGRPRGDRRRRRVRDRALAAARRAERLRADLPGRRRRASTRPSRQAQDDPTGGAPDISGITATDDTTLEIKLTDTSSLGVIGASDAAGLAPRCRRSTRRSSTRRTRRPTARTRSRPGPYMIENDAETASSTGYTPNKEIHLVRNPNWEASDGGLPARVPRRDRRSRRASPTRSRRRRRSSTGSAQVNGDFTAPPTVDQAGGDLG